MTGMVGPWVSGIAAVLVVAVVGLAAQGTPPTTRPSSTTQVYTGCVEAAPDGRGFVLAEARPVPAGDSTRTSAAAGTSATGDAPTGSITGDTPTGSTATTAAAPLPEAGEPASSANPASPTYNRGAVTEGTSGSATAAATGGAKPAARRLRLVAPGAIDLAAHRGHLVEVRGTLSTPAGGTDGVSRQAGLPAFAVTAVTHRAATCTP